MQKIIEGIYENGEIILKEKPDIKRSKVMVTFIGENNNLKAFTRLPDVITKPIKVSKIRKVSREELHER
jgi:predicted DNA-binding antitoxin AbrB/MazE fold protein